MKNQLDSHIAGGLFGLRRHVAGGCLVIAPQVVEAAWAGEAESGFGGGQRPRSETSNLLSVTNNPFSMEQQALG